METDSIRIYNGFKDAKLDLAGYREVPDGGQYTLTVKDGVGTTIATETFDFVGPHLSISEVSLTWSYWEYSDEYWLEGLSFKVANSGDLPAYIADVRITLNGIEDTSLMSEKVLSGEEKQCDPYVWISDVPPGTKTFTMELLDGAGKVIASYSATVTPSE